MEQEVTTKNLQENLAACLERVAADKERLVVLRDGSPLAVLVPLEDLWKLQSVEDDEDAIEGARALKEFIESGEEGIPLDQVLQEMNTDSR